MPHLEYQELTENDPNFPKGRDEDGEGYYRILLDRSQEAIVTKLSELKTLIETGNLRTWEFSGMKAIWFSRHLYEPLLYLDQNIVEVSPVPLNKGERNLVEDVKAFHDGASGFFVQKELYLLRNLSKGRGVGFFEAGNFHPDFIFWLIRAHWAIENSLHWIMDMVFRDDECRVRTDNARANFATCRHIAYNLTR